MREGVTGNRRARTERLINNKCSDTHFRLKILSSALSFAVTVMLLFGPFTSYSLLASVSSPTDRSDIIDGCVPTGGRVGASGRRRRLIRRWKSDRCIMFRDPDTSYFCNWTVSISIKVV